MTAMGFTGIEAPRLRITRRGRAVLTFLIAIPLAFGAVAFGVGALGDGALGASAGTQAASSTFQYVTVEPGESLWQLAGSIDPTADPRDVVADLLSLNNLPSGDVQPGLRLAIPSKYSN